MKNKNLTIETLRGGAIFFMVLGHVIGDSSHTGLEVNDDSFLRFFYYMFENIRMPLFTIISGYVYTYKPVSKFSSNTKFISGKIVRLLIPLAIVSTLFFLTQYAVPGTNTKNNLSSIWMIYIYPYSHFWFLQGMFIVFLLITILESIKALNSFRYALLVLTIPALIYLSAIPIIEVFSLDKVPFLLTFFIIGLIFKRFQNEIFKRKTITISVIVFTFIYAYSIYLFNHRLLNPSLAHLLTLIIGSTACLLLINIGFKNKQLIWLGNLSYCIYLFHVFGSAASRILLNKLGVHNISLEVLSGLVVALSLPIILKLVCPQNGILSMLLFGDKVKVNYKIDAESILAEIPKPHLSVSNHTNDRQYAIITIEEILL